MKYNLSSFFCGLVFGLGLLLSGMANPEKVLGFLDIAGLWDPSLALVMAGAIGVGLIAFTVAGQRQRSLLGFEMELPTSRSIDRPLVVGSLLFGGGWGLAGFCPGPGLVAMGAGEIKAIAFVGAMVVGMMIFEQIEQARKAHALTQA
ncbi:YeeE/YedE family protein [Marinobacter salicampi]|uniref:YeeE/YedE family protein n=1 Tax=Marinobacter salicampi TaxID=435907 RepID=UPI0014092A3C|nr:YeeE/YedE family protein [Marinobacter salicampi]